MTTKNDSSSTPDEQSKTKVGSERKPTEVAAELPGVAYLVPETGEVLFVPKEEITEFRNHYYKWGEAIREHHSAAEAYYDCETALSLLNEMRATPGIFVDPETEAKIHQRWEQAADWFEKTSKALRDGQAYGDIMLGMDNLAPYKKDEKDKKPKPVKSISEMGKQLVELIPLHTDPNFTGPPPEEVKKSNKPVLADGKIKWDIINKDKPIKTLYRKDHDLGVDKDRIHYVNKDKIGKAWPVYKDDTKWSDVYKADENGGHTLNKGKLKDYVKEQLLKKVDITLFKVGGDDVTGTLIDGLFWTAEHKYKDTDLIKMDLSGEAALLRYTYGASAVGKFNLREGVTFNGQAKAEIALAEAKGTAKSYLPHRDGILLNLTGIKDKDGKEGKEFPLGAFRFQFTIEIYGVVGAGIGVEGSFNVKVIPNERPEVSGVPAARPKKIGDRLKGGAMTLKEADKPVEVKASAQAFAGVEGGAKIAGAFQWRDPENRKKEFVEFAVIGACGAVQAGAGASALFEISYVNGMFKVTAHASVCVGVGAKGKITAEVGLNHLHTFMRTLYHQLYNVNFHNLEIITKEGFDAWSELSFMAIVQAQLFVVMTPAMTIDRIIRDAKDWPEEIKKAEKRQELANNVLKDPLMLKYSPPETRGKLIFLLSRHGARGSIGTGEAHKLGNEYLKEQRTAILLILRHAQTKSDIDNVIQHMHPEGKKGSLNANVEELIEFFKWESAFKRDVPFVSTPEYKSDFEKMYKDKPGVGQITDTQLAQLGGDFGAWHGELYANLKDEPTRGYPVYKNNTAQYAMQRDGRDDHPIFGNERGTYYVV